MKHTAKIKKLIDQQNSKIPELEAGADYVGSCWESEKLGYARGYVDALQEVLKMIELNRKIR